MKTFSKGSIIVLIAFLTIGITAQVSAATAVNLGYARSFAILGGSTITNTGSTVVNGDLGLSPGNSVTGFPPGLVNGNKYIADTVALQAKTDLTAAYLNAAGQTPVTTVPTELGGTVKLPGTYDSTGGTFGITGTLTLDGLNNPDSVFIFKTSSTLVTAGNSVVLLTNGAQACNIFWQVGTSATLGTSSIFKGNLMALTAITLTTGANVEGRVLARNAAVTLDSNIITRSLCTGESVTSPTFTPTPSSRSAATLPDTGISLVLPSVFAVGTIGVIATISLRKNSKNN